jgi:PAS domain S-box-containing protein
VGIIFLAAIPLLALALDLFYVVKWSDHSYDVLEQTNKCESQVIDLQNQVRGYVITGGPSLLDSLEQQGQQMDKSFARLKTLVKDNPRQVDRAEAIIQAKDAWLAHTRENVVERSQLSIPNPNQTIVGTNLMSEVKNKFNEFIAVEEDLRQQRLTRVRRMKQILIYAGGGLFMVLSLAVGQLVRRDFINMAGTYRVALSRVEQRQAELHEQKEWFRVTLSSIGDGVIVTDEKGRVAFMNHEAELLTGWNSLEAHLKPLPLVFNIINEKTRTPVEDPVVRVFREKKVVGLANRTVLISSQGQECPIEDSAAPIYNARGEMLGVVLVFHNATELRSAQNTLKAYSEELEKKVAQRTVNLEQTVAELETFSYSISHDLRSPLRAMQGFAQALMEDYAGNLDERGKHYLNRIQKAAERLDRLIQDLLAYTRMAHEETPLVPIDLNKLVRDIIEHYPNFRPPAVEIEIAGGLPTVMGREAALTQVVSNLLGNATKFVSAGTVPHIKISSEPRGDKVRIWIEDDGIGIAPRDFDRIFQMFIQINDSSLYGGTGVGLAIVKKAVLSMQGSVGLESKEGVGSKFWVELIRGS